MKIYEVSMTDRHTINDEAVGLTREQWDQEFKTFFKDVSECYNEFQLKNFIFEFKDDSIITHITFRFEPESNWDMSESHDSTVDFFGILYGDENSVGRFMGNGAGNNKVYEVEDMFLHSELPPIFHEKYVLHTRK